MMCIRKLWRLSGYDIPEEAKDHCCKNEGAMAKMGNMLGLGKKADQDHEDHKEIFKYLDSKEMAVYRGWQNIPYACLKMCVDHPYVYDILKFDLLKWEF